MVPAHAGGRQAVGGTVRLQDRHRSAVHTAFRRQQHQQRRQHRQQGEMLEVARQEGRVRGAGPVDAARAGRGEEEREAGEGLGVARGPLFGQGEAGG